MSARPSDKRLTEWSVNDERSEITGYRAAIIGCGSIANSHASGYNRVEATTIVACADPVEAKAQSFAQRNSIPNCYADYRQMLEIEKPDIVSVCTWHPLHAEMTIAAAARQPKLSFARNRWRPTWAKLKR